MNSVVRRRFAVGAVSLSTALVVGLVVAPSASAGNIAKVDPSFAFNNDNSETLTLTTASDFTPVDPITGSGTYITLTRDGFPMDSITAPTDSFTSTKQPKATFNFQDTGSGETDGPANPGVYNVDVEDDRTGNRDSCQRCFQVFPPAVPLSLSTVEPRAIAAGGAANVLFTGQSFARGSKIEFLLPGTSTVDAGITVSAPLKAGSLTQCGPNIGCQVPDPERTTNLTMKRRVAIAVTDPAGPRDVRVTNTDGATTTCAACFTVNGAPLTSVSPDSATNSPSATNTVRITFRGGSVPQSGTPQLVFNGNAGSSTKNDLTLVGTNVTYSPTSVSADYDFRNAAPGTNIYTPTLTQTDGSENTCGCTFSVGQSSPPTVTSVDPSSAKQSDSRTVTINGRDFSRGVRIVFSGTGIDVTSVQFVSPSQVRASIQVQSTAMPGKRDVSAPATDGKPVASCVGCFTVLSSASPSSSASATSTATMTPRPSGCPSSGVTVRVNTRTINATGLASVTVTGAAASATVQLQGYSQNHQGDVNFDNDPTPVDRTGRADDNGTVTFNDLRPASNTRLRARQLNCTYNNQSDVIEVRAQETLEVVRTGSRSYTFRGRSIPAREGGLIVSLYRILGSACPAGVEPRNCPGEKFIGQGRAVSLGSPGEGLYSIKIRFPAADQNKRDEFVVKTGRDAQNAPGRSNARSLLIN